MYKIKIFNDFLFESNNLSYYAFDWDDNLLYMPTKIKLKKNINGELVDVEVSTDEYALIRSKICHDESCPEGHYVSDEHTYDNFIDSDQFLDDVKIALENKEFAPSFEKFKNVLINGQIFAIITARSLTSNNIKQSIEYIIYEFLTDNEQQEMIDNLMYYTYLFDTETDNIIDDYLDKCLFVGVNSDEFKKQYNISGGINSPEKSKLLALEEFNKKINSYGDLLKKTTSLEFSDDDQGTINYIDQNFNDDTFNNEFILFDTSNRISNKIKRNI